MWQKPRLRFFTFTVLICICGIFFFTFTVLIFICGIYGKLAEFELQCMVVVSCVTWSCERTNIFRAIREHTAVKWVSPVFPHITLKCTQFALSYCSQTGSNGIINPF